VRQSNGPWLPWWLALADLKACEYLSSSIRGSGSDGSILRRAIVQQEPDTMREQ
jgi:hypothetical protein